MALKNFFSGKKQTFPAFGIPPEAFEAIDKRTGKPVRNPANVRQGRGAFEEFTNYQYRPRLANVDAEDALRYMAMAGHESEESQLERLLAQLKRSRNDVGVEHQRELMRYILEKHAHWREEKIDPNSQAGIMQL